jgi:MFS family permease
MTFPTPNHTSDKLNGGVVPSDSTGSTEVLLEGWGYYGWIITGTLLVLVTVVWGSYYAFGVFLKPLAEEFEWTRATTSGPYGLSLGVQGLVGLAVGAICDRYGPHAVTVFACLTTAVGYVFMSRMHSLWEFYLSMLVLVAIGTSTGYVVPVATIPQWFVQRRGLALGLALAGMGIGDMVFPRLMTYLIGRDGWRSAYLVMAGIVVGVALLCAALLRRSPQRAQSEPHAIREDTATETFTVRQLLKLKHFWNLFALWALMAAPLQIIRAHIVPAATDSGMSEASAAFVLTALGASVTAFRVGMGPISDWAGTSTPT